MKSKACTCKQCKFIKNKRKNRKNKSIISRLINKKRRTNENSIFTYYWS